jgi:hypothetical protein
MLTNEEKARIRHHMGYLNVQAAATFQLGVPAALQTTFMIELAFTKILPEAENMVKEFLCRLNDVEKQVFGNLDLAEIESTGTIKVDPKRLAKLAQTYKIAQEGLANLLGVPPNPFDMRSWLAGAGGMNVPVG